MNPPVFPDDILQPIVPMPSEPTASSPVSSPINQPKQEPKSEATPSLPPAKKGKTACASSKGKAKMTVVEISHYYSSSDKEQTPSPPMHAHRKARASTTKATKMKILEEKKDDSDAESSGIIVTKELRSSKSRTLHQMA